MFEYRILFGTNFLTIVSKLEFQTKLLEHTSTLLKNFSYELNHREVGSSSFNFNNSQVNLPIHVKDEFVEFLKVNLKYIGIENFEPVIDNPEDFLEINFEEKIVKKLKKITINSDYFRNLFILLSLKSFFIL